jgi:hypothetical protein
LLDDWLARALEPAPPSPALAAARAALLSGAAPDWPATLFAPPGEAGLALDRSARRHRRTHSGAESRRHAGAAH